MLTEFKLTPEKGNPAKLRRSYTIADMALALDAADGEYEPQVSNKEYKLESQPDGAIDEFEGLFDDDPTPKKKQKMTKVLVWEAINASCKEHEPPKVENKVWLITTSRWKDLIMFVYVCDDLAVWVSFIVQNQQWNSFSITWHFSIIISVLWRRARQHMVQLQTGLLR